MLRLDNSSNVTNTIDNGLAASLHLHAGLHLKPLTSHETASDDTFAYVILRIAKTIKIIYPLAFYIVGIPGNFLTIITLRRKIVWANFMSPYLASLAALNIACLICNSSRNFIFGLINYDIHTYSEDVCYYRMWFVLYFYAAGNWMIVLVTTVRALHFHFSETKAFTWIKYLFTSWFAFLCIVVMAAIVMLHSYHSLPEYIEMQTANNITDIKWSHCIATYSDTETCRVVANASFYVNSFLDTLIPAVIIVIINICVVRTFWKRTPVSSLKRNSVRAVGAHLSLMVFVQGVQFIFSIVPINAHFALRNVLYDLDTCRGRAMEDLSRTLVTEMLNSTYATNVLIFFFFGSRLRKELVITVNNICSISRCIIPTIRSNYNASSGHRTETTRQAIQEPEKPSDVHRSPTDQAITITQGINTMDSLPVRIEL